MRAFAGSLWRTAKKEKQPLWALSWADLWGHSYPPQRTGFVQNMGFGVQTLHFVAWGPKPHRTGWLPAKWGVWTMWTKGLAYNLQGYVPGSVGVKPCLLEANTVHCGRLEGLGCASPPSRAGAPKFRDRKGTPKNFCDKDFAELSGELSGAICLKTLVLMGNDQWPPRIVQKFFGAVRAIFWLWGSFWAPEKLQIPVPCRQASNHGDNFDNPHQRY